VITDRKKDLIKTAGGKYVAPQKLEGLLKEEPLISHVLIHGDQKKYVTALICIDDQQITSWAQNQNIALDSTNTLDQLDKSREDLIQNLKKSLQK
jgi:long-chain acyl-CoA synthetase